MPRSRSHFWPDALLLLCGTVVAFAIRFEGLADLDLHLPEALPYLVLTLPVRLGVFWYAGIYKKMWRYASVADLATLVFAGGFAALVNLLLGAVILPSLHLMSGRVPLAVLALDGAFTIGLPALLRLSQRRRDRRRGPRTDRTQWKSVLIAGAGSAGRMIAIEMKENPDLQLRAVGFLDDDREKQGQQLVGIPVLGTIRDMESVVRSTGANELIIAIPTASGSLIRDITQQAAEIGLPTRTVPGLFEIVSGRVSVTALRKVEIDDLMRREPVKTDLAAVRAMVKGRRVLVTGAGGSIGSELCRQIVSFGPAKLALLGHGENSIFEIDRELRQRAPEVTCLPILCDVRDRERLERIFDNFRPELVFHAAAHKHVPMMEANPNEAITNNVMGTRNVVECARQFKAERFLMVSTDKVVRPTSVMGASKRVAEMVVQQLGASGDTRCTAVRFGNVLGSRGSVVPLFLDQIRRGVPITITHPQVRRFFMTIPEAVQLILQAMTMGKGGEVFALDMGDAVRIADLARDLIKLSGLEPERDIPIVYTGLRPGEKLYEEVFFDQESAEPTPHAKILKSRMTRPPENLLRQVDALIAMALAVVDRETARRRLQSIVPDFQVPGEGPKLDPMVEPAKTGAVGVN